MATKKSEKSAAKVTGAVDVSSAAAEKPARARKPAKANAVEVLAPAAEVLAPAAEVLAPVKPEESAIRARAHAIFLAQGGDALENWLRAERELAAGA